MRLKFILTILTFLLSISTFSQEYPRIEKDSTGQVFVIMTLEQAQVLDNKAEILSLFEDMNIQVGQYDEICLKVINDKEEVIAKQDILIKNLNDLNGNKDDQISNLKNQIESYSLKNLKCEEILENKNKEIDIHKEKIRKQKNRMIIGGSIGGAVISGLILLIIR